MKRTLMAVLLVGGLWGNVLGAQWGARLGAQLGAQERADEGERIRIEHHLGAGEPEMVEGWLVRIHPGDSIVMATRIDRDRISFRTALVDRVQVHRIETRGTRMAILGTLAAGLIIFPFTESECSPTRAEVCFGRGTVLYAAAGGFLLGGVIGSFMEVPTWKDVAPESFRIPTFQPAVTFDGGLGFSARFALPF